MLKYSPPRLSSFHGFLKQVIQGLGSLISATSKNVKLPNNSSAGDKLDVEIYSPVNLEEYLLKLCRECENSNKVIRIKSLYLRARKDTKIPRLRIETAINNLILSKKIIPDRFLHVHSVLKNETRKKLYDLISSRPASQALDLKKEAGIGAKILAWHLKQLIDFKQIKLVNFGTKMLFALPTQDERDAITYHVISRNDIDRDILAMLASKPTPKSTLVGQDPAKRTTILYHLNNLEQWKLIEIVNPGGAIYQLSSNSRDSVLRMLQKFHPSVVQVSK